MYLNRCLDTEKSLPLLDASIMKELSDYIGTLPLVAMMKSKDGITHWIQVKPSISKYLPLVM
jgi:hypothetical protein